MTKKKSTSTRRQESQAAAARAAAIRKEQERREARRRGLVVGGVVAVVLLVVVGIGYVVQSSRDTTGSSTAAPTGAVDTYALPVGDASAPATVTIYEDFMCPFCGQLEATSRTWLAQYAADGKVAVRYVPISILDDASSGTEYSTRAASALAVVLDASGPEVAKKFHDLLYENQPAENSEGLSDATLVDLAVRAGAEKSAVSSGIDDRSYAGWVKNSTDEASKQDGYQGTPYVQLDGKPFQGGQSVEEVSAALKKAVDDAQG